MKIEIVQTFYGRPDESLADDFTLFLEGGVVDVPDAFASMIISKGLAKAVTSKITVKKEAANETQ